MKNLRVHRINFFEPEPKSIRCIAYDKSIARLAVSKSDASIEIWDVTKNPYLEKVIPGLPNTSVEALAWCNGRLFSAGLQGYISEYDLFTSSKKYQMLVTSGCPIWCMAVNKQQSSLAIGNEDGHVILHDFSFESLDFQKKFDRQEGSILCLAWHKYGHVIVTGSMDTIRVWNVDTGHVVNRIILGRSEKNRATVVWCISILSDMTIVSGDSCGKTSFWDGSTGTLLSSQAIHDEDVLSLCLNEDETEIYASGVDPIIQMFMQSLSNNKWLKAVQRIVHTHDVRALQIYDNFLVSGGDDCNLVFTKYPPKTTVKYVPFCQMSYSVVAPVASCVLLRYASYLELWKIGATSPGTGAKKLVQIKAKENEIIMCSSVSTDGRWVAYSSQFQMRLFYINLELPGAPSISKVTLSENIPNSASILLFTSKSTKLITYSKGKFFIIKCGKDLTAVEGIIEEHQECGGQTHLMELSSNSLYLATGSHNGNVTVYHLESLKVLYTLPQYKYQPTALKFDPHSENLIVAYCDRKVIEYNLKKEAYTNWSKKEVFLKLQEISYFPITSIVHYSDKVYFSDENCIYVFDKTEQSQPNKKKKKQSESSTEYGDDTFKSITKYEHISSIHAFQNDLVVVQISPRHIQNALPPPIWKKKYGT